MEFSNPILPDVSWNRERRHNLFKKIIIKATIPVLTGNGQKRLVHQVRESNETTSKWGALRLWRDPQKQLTAATIMSPRARSRETDPYHIS